MIKNECEIVKDLLPNYIENQISDGTKEFVESHIKNCSECGNMLNFLKEGQNEEEIREENEKDINYLKKYNRKMFILKTIAIILAVFIIVTWVILCVVNIRENQAYAQGGYVLSIIGKAYENIEEIKNSDNYSYIGETDAIYYIDNMENSTYRQEILYKDGKYKEIFDNYSDNIHYINYGIVQKEKNFYVQYNDENYDREIADASISYTNYNGYSGYNVLESYYKKDILECSNFEVKEEEYEGIEYYVIEEDNVNGNTEILIDIWIRKDNMQLYKIVTETVGISKIEDTFTWTAGNVTDEDLKIEGVDMEKVEKAIQETMQLYGNF